MPKILKRLFLILVCFNKLWITFWLIHNLSTTYPQFIHRLVSYPHIIHILWIFIFPKNFSVFIFPASKSRGYFSKKNFFTKVEKEATSFSQSRSFFTYNFGFLNIWNQQKLLKSKEYLNYTLPLPICQLLLSISPSLLVFFPLFVHYLVFLVMLQLDHYYSLERRQKRLVRLQPVAHHAFLHNFLL